MYRTDQKKDKRRNSKAQITKAKILVTQPCQQTQMGADRKTRNMEGFGRGMCGISEKYSCTWKVLCEHIYINTLNVKIVDANLPTH